MNLLRPIEKAAEVIASEAAALGPITVIVTRSGYVQILSATERRAQVSINATPDRVAGTYSKNACVQSIVDDLITALDRRGAS